MGRFESFLELFWRTWFHDSRPFWRWWAILGISHVEQHPSVPASAIKRPSPWVSVSNLPFPYKDTSHNGLRALLMQYGLILT